MPQGSLPSDWVDRFSDPYAVLGIAVTADDRRVLKRYRSVAKVLHPDSYALEAETTQQFASQLFARLINPAYQKLKQEKSRTESSAMLRFQVRRLNREGPLQLQSERARQLIKHPAAEVDVFYEQVVAELAEQQYQPLSHFETITQELGELNLAYFQLKMGEVLVREKRTGLMSATEARPIQFTPAPVNPEAATESYARRHYRRAQEYAKKGAWPQAVQELRDAIKMEADQSEYHALLGIAYLQQNLPGMATVYIRQALKLNPNDPLAKKYAAKVGIQTGADQNGSGKPNSKAANDKPAKSSGLFGLFRGKK